MQSKHQSEIASLNEELSQVQKMNQSLQTNNRSLVQSNDDLRNNSGLRSRKEQAELQQRITDLVSENEQILKFVNMSNINAVQKANNMRLKAEMDKRKAERDAAATILSNEVEKKTAIKNAKAYAERARKNQYVAYGLVISMLLIASAIHTGFWGDLFLFFAQPLGVLWGIWWECIETAPEDSVILQGVFLIGIPAAVIGGIFLIDVLFVKIYGRKNLLTIVFCIFNLALSILMGDELPFNRIWLLLGFSVTYLLFCYWADQKWKDYPYREQWEQFQRDLIL